MLYNKVARKLLSYSVKIEKKEASSIYLLPGITFWKQDFFRGLK